MNSINIELKNAIVEAFYAVEGAHKTRAGLIREASIGTGIGEECATLAAVLESMYLRDKPGAGELDDKIAGKLRNAWNADKRRAIVSALQPSGLSAKVSVKLDKLRPGMAVCKVVIEEYVENEDGAAFSVRKRLEGILGNVGAIVKNTKDLSEEQIAVLEKLNEDVLRAALAFEAML